MTGDRGGGWTAYPPLSGDTSPARALSPATATRSPRPDVVIAFTPRDAVLPAWVTTLHALREYFDHHDHELVATVGAKRFVDSTSIFEWVDALRMFATSQAENLDILLLLSGQPFRAFRKHGRCFVMMWSSEEQRSFYVEMTEEEVVAAHDGLLRQMVHRVDPVQYRELSALEALFIVRPHI